MVPSHYDKKPLQYIANFNGCKNNNFQLNFLYLSSLELIVYTWSGVRPSSVVVHNAQTSSSETPLPIKAKFYVDPPWVGGTKFCSRYLGHLTKMAATPIHGKNPSKIFSGTEDRFP